MVRPVVRTPPPWSGGMDRPAAPHEDRVQHPEAGRKVLPGREDDGDVVPGCRPLEDLLSTIVVIAHAVDRSAAQSRHHPGVPGGHPYPPLAARGEVPGEYAVVGELVREGEHPRLRDEGGDEPEAGDRPPPPPGRGTGASSRRPGPPPGRGPRQDAPRRGPGPTRGLAR